MSDTRTRTGDGQVEPIIQLDGIDGTVFLDEFVLADCAIHLERMDAAAYWIGVYRGDRAWHIQLGAVNQRAQFYAMVEEDSA